jgi:hypothetical protein
MKFPCFLGVVFDPLNIGLSDIRSLKYISVEMLIYFVELRKRSVFLFQEKYLRITHYCYNWYRCC